MKYTLFFGSRDFGSGSGTELPRVFRATDSGSGSAAGGPVRPLLGTISGSASGSGSTSGRGSPSGVGSAEEEGGGAVVHSPGSTRSLPKAFKWRSCLTTLGTLHHQGSMRKLKKDLGSSLAKGAGVGTMRQSKIVEQRIILPILSYDDNMRWVCVLSLHSSLF